ncbi:unnamed protein product, partial [Prorocentrum cordatum]
GPRGMSRPGAADGPPAGRGGSPASAPPRPRVPDSSRFDPPSRVPEEDDCSSRPSCVSPGRPRRAASEDLDLPRRQHTPPARPRAETAAPDAVEAAALPKGLVERSAPVDAGLSPRSANWAALRNAEELFADPTGSSHPSSASHMGGNSTNWSTIRRNMRSLTTKPAGQSTSLSGRDRLPRPNSSTSWQGLSSAELRRELQSPLKKVSKSRRRFSEPLPLARQLSDPMPLARGGRASAARRMLLRRPGADAMLGEKEKVEKPVIERGGGSERQAVSPEQQALAGGGGVGAKRRAAGRVGRR